MDNTLKLGDTGSNVKILQEKLKILGYFNPIITGSFGLATEEGVKAFQRENNLESTGIVDNDLWQMLMEYTDKSYRELRYPTLKIGSSGDLVSELQSKLKALLYYSGSVNGTFDLETENAVKRLQYNNDLTTSGIVNDQTWDLIDILYGNLSSCITSESDNNKDNETYIVQRGDTLYSIANKFGTTVDEIKSLNKLTSNTLQIGQMLNIPTKVSENVTTYMVQKGDTLYSIANKFGTTVDEIKSLNKLTSNTLRIGQILNIPTKVSENVTTYMVQKGDTLYSIANKFGTTVDEIKSLNSLTSNTLQIGQILNIPQ